MKLILVGLLVLGFSAPSSAQNISRNMKEEPLPLNVTHMLPSAFVIPAGVVVLGTTSGAGFFDVFDITTNLYLDLQQVLNLTTKVNLFKSDIMAGAIFASFRNQTVRRLVIENGVQGLQSNTTTTISPGLVFSYRMRRKLIGHAGATMAFQSPAVDPASLSQRTALVQGHSLFKEVAYGISPTVSLATGISYDLTYSIWGAGLSVHLGNFQIGGHYYFDVREGAVLPILGGGYSAKLD